MLEPSAVCSIHPKDSICCNISQLLSSAKEHFPPDLENSCSRLKTYYHTGEEQKHTHKEECSKVDKHLKK